ncbi:MAG TPA: hypothetical protein VIL69_00100 [Roseomonas sp.]|jgi:hypothetical protein
MSDYVDMRWHGPEDTMEQALLSLPSPAVQVGPRTLDGIAYVLRREHEPKPLPGGLDATGAELSVAILGMIAEEVA